MIRVSSSVLSNIIAFFCFLAIGLGIFVVYFSIERANIASEILRAERKLTEYTNTHAKLETERDKLLNPDRLRKKAPLFGLHVAMPWQIRRISSSISDSQKGIN